VSTQNGFRILSVSDAIKAINNGDTKNISYTSSIAEQQRIKEVWTETTTHMNDSKIGFIAKEQ
jgi:hypothetical protein